MGVSSTGKLARASRTCLVVVCVPLLSVDVPISVTCMSYIKSLASFFFFFFCRVWLFHVRGAVPHHQLVLCSVMVGGDEIFFVLFVGCSWVMGRFRVAAGTNRLVHLAIHSFGIEVSGREDARKYVEYNNSTYANSDFELSVTRLCARRF